ncbi:MAG: DNA repair protein RecO [Lachnospiraceae bacterium]|nr:DNA repair protein RecO [Lachnospiraceae bacterium]
MKEQIKVKGIVLLQAPVGEYDRRVVLLTLEKGKISAFARGARRPNSPLIGVCQPMTFGTFFLYAGRNSFTLLSAEADHYFPELKKDLLSVSYGTYFLELAAWLTRENNDEREILKLLYASLRTLEKNKIPKKLIRCIFELRIMTCFGEGIQAFSCIECGREDNLFFFSGNRGGCYCKNCKSYASDVLRLEESTLYTLQYIIVTPIEKLFHFVVSEPVLLQLMRISRSYISSHVRGEFKSLEMIDVLEIDEMDRKKSKKKE